MNTRPFFRVYRDGYGYVTNPMTRDECKWYIEQATANGGTGYSIHLDV